jgi:protein-L-isoaspartate(D-aspartate) O-methyltransferase
VARDFVAEARAAGVRDERVLAALSTVDRARFAPSDAGRQVGRDAPVPLPCDQTTSQPSLVALMVEALALAPGARVLEVGTGYGFQAAVLAEMTGASGEVWTMERWEPLAAEAQVRLASYPWVHVMSADGSGGLPDQAPYDGIVVAARCPEVPTALVGQLVPGGRLVAPIGPEGREHCLVLRRVREKGDDEGRETPTGSSPVARAEIVADLGPVRFVPLVHGAAT